jgi:hypothetical protein
MVRREAQDFSTATGFCPGAAPDSESASFQANLLADSVTGKRKTFCRKIDGAKCKSR